MIVSLMSCKEFRAIDEDGDHVTRAIKKVFRNHTKMSTSCVHVNTKRCQFYLLTSVTSLLFCVTCEFTQHSRHTKNFPSAATAQQAITINRLAQTVQ